MIGRRLCVAAMAMAAACGTGCASSGGADRADAADAAVRWRPCGRVVRVRPADGWLVLECPVAPPPGAVVSLVRDGRSVGRARATARRAAGYVIAEILDGQPATGDSIGAAP